MSDQHPLDDFLKKKLEERSFPYQDAYWEAASALIDQDRKKRRGFLWLWLLLGLTISSATLWGVARFFQPQQTPLALFDRTDWGLFTTTEDSCAISGSAFPSAYSAESLRSTLRNSASTSAVHSPKNRGIKPPRAARTSTAPTQPAPEMASQALYQTLSVPASQRPADWESEIELMGMKQRAYWLATDLRSAFSWREKGDWRQDRHRFGIVLGTQLAPAWRGGQGQRPSLAPVAGVFYRFALAPSLRLQASLLYQNRSQLNRDTTFTSVEFGFGRTETATTLSTSALHFVTLPLVLDYSIGSRHGLSVGVEPAWLAGIKTNVSTATLNDLVLTEAQQAASWRYLQGYRRWDLSLQLGYHYYLGQGLRIGTVASYGLRDLTDNDFYTQGWVDRQLNWRMWLEYDLGRFGGKKMGDRK